MLLLASLGAVLALAPPASPEPPPASPEPPLPSSPLPSSPPSACTERASWTGLVVDGDTGEGVPGAQVELRPRAGEAVVYARTDDEGQVRVEGLCTGTMQVTVSKSEHESREERVDLGAPQVETTIYLEALHAHHSERVITVHDDSHPHMGSSVHLAGAELAKTRGAGLSDAISGVSGVSTLRGTAGGMGKPVIRGQVGRRNLIVFDGIRHEGQRWGLDHAPEIDPYAAGRITVIKGAATTRFGPDAIGGVVLVEPRPLLRMPGIAGEVSTMGGSNPLGGGLAARFDHAPRLAPGFAWRVEGNFGVHRATLSPTYPLDNTGSSTWNLGARLGYLRERFDFEAGYRLLRTRAGICYCLRISTPTEFALGLVRDEPVNADLYSAEFQIERPSQAYWHHLAMARSRVELGVAGELHLTYAYQFNDREEFEIIRGESSVPQLSFGLATHTANLLYEQPVAELGRNLDLVGTLGVSFSHQDNDFTAATTLIPDYTQVGGGVFLVERLVARRLEVELGGRYDGLDRRAGLRQLDFLGQRAGGRLDEEACTRRTDGGADCREDFHTPSATFGLLTRPIAEAPEFSWRVDFNSSARIPAIDEQFMNGAAPSFPILGLGDSNIGIERTWSGATSLIWSGDWLDVDASAYLNYIDDYIYFTPEPQEGQCAPLSCTARGPLPVFEFVPVDALFGGAELDVDLRAPRLPLQLRGNAAWVRAQELGSGEFLTFVPSDRYTLAGRWLWPDTAASSNGYLEVNGTLVDRQRRYDPAADFAAPPPAYVLLGAGLGVEFPIEDYLVRTSLLGANLLNSGYREYTSLLRYFADEPGWSLTLRVAVEFSIS